MSFSTPGLILLHIASFSLVISLAVSGFMISAGLLDVPVDRSNHKNIVPTAGGIGIVGGMGTGLLALALFYPMLADQSLLGAVAALAVGIACLGLLDDLSDVNAAVKFLVMIIIVSAGVAVIGSPDSLPISMLELALPVGIGFAGAVLWMFVVINAVNFVDGSNGLMGGFMTIAFIFMAAIAALVQASTTAILAAICAAAIAGFLPYNWREKAYIFCGDVGALLIEFCYGACGLILVTETGYAALLYVGPLLILPLLTDVLLTMLMRWRHKEKLMSAHSHHLYQRMVRAGYSHSFVALVYALGAAIAGFSAMIGMRTGLIASLFYLGLCTCLWVMVYFLIHRKFPKERS